jgi:hypothetical protein
VTISKAALLGIELNEVDQAKAKLQALKAEAHTLSQRKRELHDEIDQIEHRIHQLYGGFGGWGEIKQAKEAIKLAELKERDKVARLVVWSVEPARYLHGGNDEPFIVDKVTPKRIYVRRRGETNSEYYNKDGGSGRDYINTKIDIAATFPEGIDEYAKANKRKS